MRTVTLASALLLLASHAWAQTPGPAASAGPGRIVCKTKDSCELGLGVPAKIKYIIDIQALPAEDKDRLTKQCKPAGKTPCIATVKGTEMADPVKIKGVSIKFHN